MSSSSSKDPKVREASPSFEQQPSKRFQEESSSDLRPASAFLSQLRTSIGPRLGSDGVSLEQLEPLLRFIAAKVCLHPKTPGYKPEDVIEFIISSKIFVDNTITAEMLDGLATVFPYVMNVFCLWFQQPAEKREEKSSDVLQAMNRVVQTGQVKALADVLESSLYPRVTEILTAREVEEKRVKYAKSIFQNHELLRRILCRDMENLGKEWRTGNSDAHRNFLRGAWRRSHLEHDLDFEENEDLRSLISDYFKHAMPQNDDTPWGESQKTHIDPEAFQIPYIDEDELSKGYNFLDYLRQRAIKCPCDFIHVDSKDWSVCHYYGKAPVFESGRVMKFWNRKDVKSYGETEKNGNFESSTYSAKLQNPDLFPPYWGDLPVAKGLIAIELQAQLYSFFVRCCLGVLRLKTRDYDNVPVPEDIRKAIPSFNIHVKSSSDSGSIISGPMIVDTLMLSAIDNMGLAKDHLINLIQEPEYFQKALSAEFERRSADPEVQGSSTQGQPSQDNITKNTIVAFIHRAIFDVLRSEGAAIHARNIRPIQNLTAGRRAAHTQLLARTSKDAEFNVAFIYALCALEEFFIGVSGDKDSDLRLTAGFSMTDLKAHHSFACAIDACEPKDELEEFPDGTPETQMNLAAILANCIVQLWTWQPYCRLAQRWSILLNLLIPPTGFQSTFINNWSFLRLATSGMRPIFDSACNVMRDDCNQFLGESERFTTTGNAPFELNQDREAALAKVWGTLIDRVTAATTFFSTIPTRGLNGLFAKMRARKGEKRPLRDVELHRAIKRRS